MLTYFFEVFSRTVNQLEWVRLNSSEYDNWINPVDKCMLNNNFGVAQVELSLQDYKSKICGNYSKNDRALKCYIGMGVGHIMPCWSPFGGRSFFGKGIKGYTDFNARYVEKIVEYLINKNETLLFVGDSVMRQG